MKQVLGKIFRLNTEVQVFSGAPIRPISCSGAVVEGLSWMVPYIQGGKVVEYRSVMQTEKPTPDSVRVLRVRVSGNTYWILVADNATVNAFTDACNLCCEAGTPQIAFPVIPEPVVEDDGITTDGVNYKYLFPIPALVSGQTIKIEGTLAGVAFSLTNSGSGYASGSALAVALEASSVADAGVWSVVGTNLVLETTTVLTAGASISIVQKNYCATGLTFPLAFNTVISNGITTALPATKTAANVTELLSHLAFTGIFSDGLLTSVDADQINFFGTSVPTKLKLDATDKATFTAGACVAATTTVPATTTVI